MDEKLPSIIVGGLPKPSEIKQFNHTPIHIHDTPDGRSERCRCGWQSAIISDPDELDRAWNEHINEFDRRK